MVYVLSDKAGIGKSFYIENECKKKKLELIRIPIYGEI